MRGECINAFYLFLFSMFGEFIMAKSPPQLVAKEAFRQLMVRPGVSITIECPVKHNRDFIFEWYKDKESIITFGSQRLRVLSNGSLRIRDSDYDDTGVYKCRAINGFGSVEYNTTLLVIGNDEDYEQYEAVYDPDEALIEESQIVISAKPRLLYVNHEKSPVSKLLGSTFMLQCVATGYPKPEIMWYKDGTAIGNQFRIGRWALRFTKALATDTGNYTCIASNSLGKTSHSFILQIGAAGKKIPGKPLIIGSNKTVGEGETVVMECAVESESLPHIKWLKQVTLETADSDTGKHSISMEGESYNVLTKAFSVDYSFKDGIYYHKLMIENTQLEDSGKYVCLGANTYGYDYTFSFLKVVRDNNYSSSISFPIVVTVVVIAVAVLGCIFVILFYCRPKSRRRPGDSSVEVPMVTKEDFLQMHIQTTNAMKCLGKSDNLTELPTKTSTYLSNGVV